jgi:AcrR family transcriptional regulator
MQGEAVTRDRLLAGLTAAIVEKGYAATTIADIARHARVSKRTLYEHFADKEACFLALYRAVADGIMRAIVEAASPALPWREQLDAATRVYLGMLESQPELARTFLLEIQAAGPQAIRVRREVHRRFAEMIGALVERGRTGPGGAVVGPLSPAMAAAIVGAINELVLLAIEEGRAHRLSELRETAVTLIEAVLSTTAKAVKTAKAAKPRAARALTTRARGRRSSG